MRKPKNWTRRDAEAFLIQMLYTIGEGFHPDTDPMDYVFTDENGVRCCTFTDGKEIKRMREGIARAREFFPSDEVELYQFLVGWSNRIYPGSSPNGGTGEMNFYEVALIHDGGGKTSHTIAAETIEKAIGRLPELGFDAPFEVESVSKDTAKRGLFVTLNYPSSGNPPEKFRFRSQPEMKAFMRALEAIDPTNYLHEVTDQS